MIYRWYGNIVGVFKFSAISLYAKNKNKNMRKIGKNTEY